MVYREKKWLTEKKKWSTEKKMIDRKKKWSTEKKWLTENINKVVDRKENG